MTMGLKQQDSKHSLVDVGYCLYNIEEIEK